MYRIVFKGHHYGPFKTRQKAREELERMGAVWFFGLGYVITDFGSKAEVVYIPECQDVSEFPKK